MSSSSLDEADDGSIPFYKRSYSGRRVLSRRIRSASLEELVVAVVANPSAEELRQTMIATFHLIPELTSRKVLKMMKSIFSHPNLSILTGSDDNEPSDVPSQDQIRKNVVLFLRDWVRSYFDFADDSALFTALLEWSAAQTKSEPLVLAPLNEAISAFEKRKTEKTNARNPVPPPSPREESESSDSGFSLLSSKYPVEAVAQHLTVLEHAMIGDIRPREYMVAWENTPMPDNVVNSPNIARYLEHFKGTRAYLISEILKHQSVKAQSQAIKRLIQIGQYCISYSNFNTTMEILSALFSPAIIGPKKTKVWEMLSSKWFEILEQLCNLMSPDDSHRNYRTALKSATEGSVPFLGVHIEDIRFLLDFNPTQTVEGLNVSKLLQLKSEIQQLRCRCENSYKFPIDWQFTEQIVTAVSTAPAPEPISHPMPTAPPRSEASDVNEEDQTAGEKKDAKADKKAVRQNRMHELWRFSDNFYSDASLVGNHIVAVKEFQLRERDHRVLSTGASAVSFDEGAVIIEEGLLTTDAAVCLVTSGAVATERNGGLISTFRAPCLLNHESVLQTGQTTPLYKATSTVELYIIDRKFLMSVLESDADLSLHFFTDLAFHLIDELTRTRPAAKGGSRARKASNRLVNRVRALSQTGSSQRLPQTIRPAKPNQNLGHMMDPKMQRDQEFLQLFDGIIDEVILREYRATMLGRTLNVQGTLFISQAHACFYAKIFNHKSKAVIPLAQLCSVSQKKNKLVVEWSSTGVKKRKAVFKLRDEDNAEVEGLISSISASLAAEPTHATIGGRGSVDPRLEKAESMECHTSSLESWKGTNSLGLTAVDWELILRGAKRITFRKDAEIVPEGCTSQRIFQIAKGHCRIEKQQEHGEPLVLGTIGSSEIFGEMGFVLCQPATASVVAESDEVEVYVIEGFYLSRLMEMRMELLARFLHYICLVMERRLMSRHRLEDQEERKVVDIITEPLHLNLVRHPVVPLSRLEPVHVICGPKDDDMEEVENCYSSAVPFCAGTAVSTYPMRDIPDPEDNTKKIAKRDGSPICDQYRVNVYESRIIAAVADGCNWGDPPRNAAVAARDAFVSYLEAHQEEITDVQFCGALILRALSMANAAIFRGLNPETQQIGTTTLLGGVVLKMQEERCNEDGDSASPVPEDTHNWGFVYGSIGDCKAFHWSRVTGKFADITASNRTESLSASDCGGRLGPHIQGCLPDLRNLELGFYPCDEGDYFMIVSDGVHDNLDPQHLGFEPLDLGLGGESWATVPDLEVAEEAKTRYRLELLQKIIKKEIDSKSPIDREEREIMRKLTDKVNRSSMDLASTQADEKVNGLAAPLDIVRQLTCYCREICAASAEWMRENPSKRLPKDYRLYPGKMDHTTCVCFVVGEQSPACS